MQNDHIGIVWSHETDKSVEEYIAMYVHVNVKFSKFRQVTNLPKFCEFLDKNVDWRD